ncbi:MAG: helicase [Oscillochloridaceae bacterium]|nr:helicase [Chloroflexaceae bacterium]MDW8390900.1 helicase [Oscillochloridaceae bacterium]
MDDLIEVLHTLARQRGREAAPLIAVRRFPARDGARVSHLPVDARLEQAWVVATGAPFRPHQAPALSALRRGEPVALQGGPSARRTLPLLVADWLREAGPGTVLALAPDEAAGEELRDNLEKLLRQAHPSLRVGVAWGSASRAAASAQVVIATPATLHERLLRFHGRAWTAFWSRLGLIALADAQRYAGLAAIHLAGLLRRARRLAGGPQPPRLVATLAPVLGAAEALAAISGDAWRVIAADDMPRPASALALWRAPAERAREAAMLALGLAQARARVHLIAAPFEAPLLRGMIGLDLPEVSVGAAPRPADAQIICGVDCAAASLRLCLESAALTVLLLGDEPAERALTRFGEHGDHAGAGVAEKPVPLIETLPHWIAAPVNAYVEAQHLVCAASEYPLGAAEVAAWGAESLVARLERNGMLVQLPDAEPLWQPGPAAQDPYADFDLQAAATAPVSIRDERGAALGTLSLDAFDRWGFPGAALPPLRGGYRVRERDEARLTLTLHSVPEARRTLPLRRCTVQVRDRLDQRLIRGQSVAWGRVVVDEEVYGFQHINPGAAVEEQRFEPPLAARWSAPALWIDLPMALNAERQQPGWSLVAALPLLTLASANDLVPAYDAEAQRLYFVDAQPGGNGLAAWLFEVLEAVLPTAYEVALNGRVDPLLKTAARADMDWMLALLGGVTPAPVERSREPVTPELPLRHEAPRHEAPFAATTPVEASLIWSEPQAPDKPPPRRKATRAGAAASERATPEGPDQRPAPRRRESSASAAREERPARRKAPSAPPEASTDRRQPPPPAPSASEEAVPPVTADPAELAARLRAMRAQRQQGGAPRAPGPVSGGEPRFRPGDSIVCVPHGPGTVVASRVEDGREILRVRFAGLGELMVDASVNLVRLAEDNAPGEA